MEIYVTKKVDSGDDFSLSPLDTMPHAHIITPNIIIKRDINGSYYLMEAAENTNVVTHLIKLKKLICKQSFKKNSDEDKFKIVDDIVWVRPSPTMYYKKDSILVPCNRMLLNYPVQLQISCKSENIYYISKPYNAYNLVWTIDYIMVDKDFNWDTLNGVVNDNA